MACKFLCNRPALLKYFFFILVFLFISFRYNNETCGVFLYLTLQLPDQICNSPYCQPYNSYKVSLENFVFDQIIIHKLILFSILITYLVAFVLIL